MSNELILKPVKALDNGVVVYEAGGPAVGSSTPPQDTGYISFNTDAYSEVAMFQPAEIRKIGQVVQVVVSGFLGEPTVGKLILELPLPEGFEPSRHTSGPIVVVNSDEEWLTGVVSVTDSSFAIMLPPEAIQFSGSFVYLSDFKNLGDPK